MSHSTQAKGLEKCTHTHTHTYIRRSLNKFSDFFRMGTFIDSIVKAVWSIPYVSVAFFPSLKQNFIAHCSSKMSDCIFEIHHLWQSGVGCIPIPAVAVHLKLKSSHKMYSNNIVNFQESTIILNTCTKKSLETYWIHHIYIYIYIYIYINK